MKKLLIALMFALAVTPLAFAHEGHDQKIMGTVSAIEAGQLTVKATTGKSSTVLLNDKTKVLMGKMVHKLADIKVGDRIVVTATDIKGKDGKPVLVAKQVNLPAPAAANK
jgi:hypothetical protein